MLRLVINILTDRADRTAPVCVKGADMQETFYKPLTPSLREDINASIEKSISELRTCQSNAFVNMQIAGYEQTKRLINGLPDGYPIPMTRRV